jgi:hypothetical protein
VLRRIRHWGDADWVDYFDKEYLYRAMSKNANVEFIKAKWHCGFGNKTMKGHGPQPRWPDHWMLEKGGHVKVNGITVRMPSIANILKANADCLERNESPVAPRMEEKYKGRVWYAMRIGLPNVVEPTLLKLMMKQVRTISPDALEKLWINEGIMVLRPDVEGPIMNTKKMNGTWRDHCLIRVNLDGDEKGVDCTCPHSRSRGHCVHEYACMRLEGIPIIDHGFPIPHASVGQAELKRRDRHVDVGSSGEESNPPPKRRKKE